MSESEFIIESNSSSVELTLESSWVSFLALVRFDDKDGQKIQCLYPPLENITVNNQFIQDLKMLCMPDCLEADSIHELVFMTRIRFKASEMNDVMMNCYISFRQYPDPASRRGYFQQSLILVSKLPYLSLFNRVLHRLVEVLSDIPLFERYDHLSESEMKSQMESNDSSYLPYDLTILDSTIEVAYQHFLQWPEPCVGKTLQLPFYGVMIQYEVPIIPIYALRDPQLRDLWNLQTTLSKHAGIDGHGGLYHTINLVAVFHRLGLLPHLWTLWELVITGKSVVVWSSSAAIASAVVTALVSLIAPLAYSGDYRPYINPYDSDIHLMGDIIANPKPVLRNSENNRSDWIPYIPSGNNKIKHQVSEDDNQTSSSHSSEDYTVFNGPIYIKSIGNEDRPNGMLIGITNPFILRSFSQADAALFIPNPDSTKPTKMGKSVKVISKRPKITNLFKSSTSLSSIFGTLSENKPKTTSSNILFNQDHTLNRSDNNDSNKNSSNNDSSNNNKYRPSRKFSALGIGLSMDREESPESSHSSHSVTSPPLSPLSSSQLSSPSSPLSSSLLSNDSSTLKTILSVKIRKLSNKESIGDVYDEWVSNGGLKVQGSNRHVLLCLRNKPLITMDPDIDSRLSALLSSSTTLPNDIQVRFQANNINPYRDSITDEPSDKEIIGNMLLREHFRNLTISMLKPFENFFHANRHILPLKRGTSNLLPILSLSSSNSGSSSSLSPPSSSTRAGASSMLLYSNPNHYFGIDDVEIAIAECKRNAELFGYNHIPIPLRRCQEWDLLLLRFAESDNFKAWSNWRRDLLIIRMLVDTSRLCHDMSTEDLIKSYAVEQGLQIITAKQLSELIYRIKSTIIALQQIHNKFHDIAAILFTQPPTGSVSSAIHATKVVPNSSSSSLSSSSITVTATAIATTEISSVLENRISSESIEASVDILDIPNIIQTMQKHLGDIVALSEINNQLSLR